MPDQKKIQQGQIVRWEDLTADGLEAGTFIVCCVYANGDFIIRNQVSRVILTKAQATEVTQLHHRKGKDLKQLIDKEHTIRLTRRHR